MSFTEEGMKRVIAGEFADGQLRGRLGLEVISVSQKRIKAKFIVVAEDDNTVLFEYDPYSMKAGQMSVLDGAIASIPIGVA
jgi:hypothetical protein